MTSRCSVAVAAGTDGLGGVEDERRVDVVGQEGAGLTSDLGLHGACRFGRAGAVDGVDPCPDDRLNGDGGGVVAPRFRSGTE